MNPEPRYLQAYRLNQLSRKIEEGYERLAACDLCPHHCGVNRLKQETGFCRSGSQVVLSSYAPHFGEEQPLVGTNGSGTIFFTFCNMRCIYCQNYEISWLGTGRRTTPEELAEIMLELQQCYRCHNINLVTPAHFVPHILAALELAIKQGLKIPLVYNCGGYEDLKTLKLLDGIIDIYMPDFKYSDPEIAQKYSGVRAYPQIARLAIQEMYRQVGDLVLNAQGVAVQGMIVRHLVLPGGLAGTEGCMKYLATISGEIFINIMSQYRPENLAHQFPPLNRRITREEYREALDLARRYGLKVRYRL
ncbi:MAG: radical SAM protein [Bacillota bacterium]|nr:radical SAM protein [Bacillota bacterium]